MWWLAATAAAVVVLLVLAVAAVHLGPARRYVLGLVFEQLRAQQIDVTADDVRYNLAALSVSFDNATVTSLRAPGLAPFATVARARVNLGMWALIRGRYEVDSARVSGVRIHYVVAPDGTTNLPTPPRPELDEPAEVVDYLVRDTLLEDARVRYEDQRSGLDVTMPVTRLSIDGQLATSRHDVEVTAGPGTALVDGRTIPIQAIAATADVGRDDVVLERLTVQAAGSQLEASGRLANFAEPAVDLTTRGDIDAAPALAAAGIDEAITGRIHLEATVSGALDALTLTASATSDGVAGRGLAPAALSLRGGYVQTENVATIDTFDLTAPWGQMSARGRVARVEGETRLSARLTGVDAERLMSALDLPSRLATRVAGDLEVVMPGLDHTGATGRAAFTLVATSPTPRADVLPVSGVVRGTASGGDVVVQVERLDALAARVTGAVTLRGREVLGGTLRAGTADAGAVVRAAEAFLGERPGALSPTPVNGPVSIDARLGGTLADPAVRAVLDAPALAVGGVRDVALSAVAEATQAAVVVPDARVTWREGVVTASGRAALTGTRAVQGRASVSALAVDALLAALELNDVPVSGTLTADAEVGGTLDAPEARVTLGGTGLVAYAEPLGTLTIDARLASQVAHVDSVVLDKPQQDGAGRIQASGTYGLTSGDYTFTLSSDNVRLEQLVLPDGTAARGAVALTGEGRGTLDQPAGTVTVAAPELQVDGREAGPLTATVALANRSATFDAVAERFATTARGVVAIDAPYQGQADVEMADLDLAALPLQLETPLTGRVRAQVHAEGPAATPADAAVTAVIQALDARWNEQPITLAGPATVGLADRIVSVEALRLEALDSTATINGRMPLDAAAAPGSVDVDARLHLATLAGYAPRGTSLSADGTMTVQGRVTGTAAAIDPDVTVTLEDALVLAPDLGTPVTGLQLLARIVGGTATVERLAAVWGTARFESSARAPLTFFGALPVELPAATGGATLDARLTGLDPGAVPGAPVGISGRVDLQVNASAPSADPAAVDGRLTFDALELGFRGLTLTQQQPSVLVARGGAATVETLALTGSAGTVEATGTVALTGDRVVDVTAAGSLDLAALSVVTDALRATGPMRFDVHAAGPAAQPQLQGFAELADGSVVIDDPAAVAIEDLAARLDLDGERVTLSNLSGLVNGGALTGSGTVTLGEDLVADADLQLAVDDLAFSAPLDLRSLSDVGLRLTRRGDTFVVGGEVRIREAGLTGDINFDTGVLGVIGRPRGLDLTAERNALLERVRFDVHVGTETPILLDNNLAKAELTTDVRVLGTPYDLGMSGRMELLEGSTVTLNERRYEVERGLITFTDDTRITPSFDLRLTTDARHYDITLGVSGEVGATETTLTANPSLPEPDIMALLVTGRTLDDMRGAEYDVAREQVLSYLTGRVGSTLGRGLERATGLSEVRVEPTLIASETDPGARLTVGQELSDGLRLVYSTDLADSSNQIWLAEYDLTRRFSTRAVRQRDNTYRVEFRHDVRFGGAPEPRRMPRVRPVITAVAVTVDEGGDEDRLRERLKLKPGDPYDFFAAREGLDRIAETLRNEGFLQSRARIGRTPAAAPATAAAAAGAEGVALTVSVTRGPRVRFQFDGAVPPGDVQRDLAVRWQRGVFDSQRSGDAADAVQAWLMGDRHMDPRIDVTVEDPGPDMRVVRLAIVPGPKFARVTLAFEGARGIDPKVLDDIVRDQDLEEDLFTDPTVVTELLRRYYREEGYLAATLDQPERQFLGDTARVVIRVSEGPRFVVTGITPTGNSAVPAQELLDEAPLRAGDPFLPAVAERSLERIRQVYWRRGYNDVQLRYDVDADRETGAAAVSIAVREGARAVVNTVAVTGTDRTSDGLVVGQLEVYPEGVLDVAALGRSRRNLYATGAYSIVEFARTPAAAPADAATSTSADSGSSDGGATSATAPAQPAPAATGDAPVDVHVTVREVQPFQLGYGASFDTERGLGGVLELTNSNSLGAARQVGISTRYDSQLRQARAYISQPFLKRFPLQTTAAVYLRQERNPLTELTQAFDLDRIGASLQQERRLANQYVWNYGVRWEQARTIDPRPGQIRDERTTVTPFTSTFTRETRDDVLDASHGSFASQALSYAPRWLGASSAYLRYYGQYFTYLPLRPPTRERLTNEILRPRLVWATGVRLGLARGLGGEVPFSERFFGGGSTSVRGVAQNGLGPRDASGIPTGGAGTLIVNSELRFPVVSIVDGVGFVDLGAVVPRVGAWEWNELRKTAGLGVRVRTPWFLLRGDYGLVLDRRSGEPRGRFFFSIGQAF